MLKVATYLLVGQALPYNYNISSMQSSRKDCKPARVAPFYVATMLNFQDSGIYTIIVSSDLSSMAIIVLVSVHPKPHPNKHQLKTLAQSHQNKKNHLDPSPTDRTCRSATERFIVWIDWHENLTRGTISSLGGMQVVTPLVAGSRSPASVGDALMLHGYYTGAALLVVPATTT